MSEDFGAILLRIGQLEPYLPAVPPVNGAFTDPRQIAQAMRDISDWIELWIYCEKPRYIGGHGYTHIVAWENETRPLYCNALGHWFIGRTDHLHFGEPDAAKTRILLKFAQRQRLKVA